MTATAVAASKKWAREYETIYILRPNVETEDADKVAERFAEIVARMGGKITKVDVWGKRKLAYLIKKHSRGIFVYVQFVAHNDVVAELERNLRLLEQVIRYQTIVTGDMIDLEAVEVDAAEVEFAKIEKTEDDDEPDFAERLGLSSPKPPPAAEAAEGEAAEGEAAEGEAAEGEAKEGEAKEGEAAAAPAEGEAKEGEAAAAPAEGEAAAAPAEAAASAEAAAPAEAAADSEEK